MDNLLKGNYFNFFVDEVYALPKVKESNQGGYYPNNLFGALLIPDIKSTYFPPYHLRRIVFPANFLSSEYYNYYRLKYPSLEDTNDINFRGSIVEGQHYSISSDVFTDRAIPEVLPEGVGLILNDAKIESPYQDYLTENIHNEGLTLLNNPETGNNEELLVYCFDVGQGDSILLIFPNKSVYIIDTNIYGEKGLDAYISTIKHILSENGLAVDIIKGLLITHKHLDHLRGAAQLMESNEFIFKYFLMNFDYKHTSKKVNELLDVANKKVTNHINVNEHGVFFEGGVKISILNPNDDTTNKKKCKDVNDSSIILMLEYGENRILLSGDAGYPITNNVIPHQKSNFLLKVSHHGSNTGTDENLLKKIQPLNAYISAGNHKKFKHPHFEVIQLLNKYNVDVDVSKNEGSVVYEITKNSIIKNKLSH